MNTYCATHQQDMMSMCCGAAAIGESDFCAQCRDHTGFECWDCEEETLGESKE